MTVGERDVASADFFRLDDYNGTDVSARPEFCVGPKN
jgi:hypothetical protein